MDAYGTFYDVLVDLEVQITELRQLIKDLL